MPFSPCVFCSSGVRQRHATVPERRHVPPPPAVPLSPRLHGHPVREGSLPGVRGVRWPAVWTSLLQWTRRRPLAPWLPRGDAAVDCYPLLKGHGWPSILNQKTHKITFTETEPLDLEDTKGKGCRDDVLKVHSKQLFCITRATALGGGLTGAAGRALDCQSEHETEFRIDGRVTSRREISPMSNLTSGCMRGEDLAILKENCIWNSEQYHNVMKIIPPQPPPPPHHHHSSALSTPSLSPSCALVTLVILRCWRVSVAAHVQYYYQAPWQVPI